MKEIYEYMRELGSILQKDMKSGQANFSCLDNYRVMSCMECLLQNLQTPRPAEDVIKDLRMIIKQNPGFLNVR